MLCTDTNAHPLLLVLRSACGSPTTQHTACEACPCCCCKHDNQEGHTTLLETATWPSPRHVFHFSQRRTLQDDGFRVQQLRLLFSCGCIAKMLMRFCSRSVSCHPIPWQTTSKSVGSEFEEKTAVSVSLLTLTLTCTHSLVQRRRGRVHPPICALILMIFTS